MNIEITKLIEVINGTVDGFYPGCRDFCQLEKLSGFSLVDRIDVLRS